ncbi:hypothetical protein Dimus_017126 [Dionaea muscipula]
MEEMSNVHQPQSTSGPVEHKMGASPSIVSINDSSASKRFRAFTDENFDGNFIHCDSIHDFNAADSIQVTAMKGLKLMKPLRYLDQRKDRATGCLNLLILVILKFRDLAIFSLV